MTAKFKEIDKSASSKSITIYGHNCSIVARVRSNANIYHRKSLTSAPLSYHKTIKTRAKHHKKIKWTDAAKIHDWSEIVNTKCCANTFHWKVPVAETQSERFEFLRNVFVKRGRKEVWEWDSNKNDRYRSCIDIKAARVVIGDWSSFCCVRNEILKGIKIVFDLLSSLKISCHAPFVFDYKSGSLTFLRRSIIFHDP